MGFACGFVFGLCERAKPCFETRNSLVSHAGSFQLLRWALVSDGSRLPFDGSALSAFRLSLVSAQFGRATKWPAVGPINLGGQLPVAPQEQNRNGKPQLLMF